MVGHQAELAVWFENWVEEVGWDIVVVEILRTKDVQNAERYAAGMFVVEGLGVMHLGMPVGELAEAPVAVIHLKVWQQGRVLHLIEVWPGNWGWFGRLADFVILMREVCGASDYPES